ncbi:Mut7-C RNAse domain-containing protein [Halobellus inordinatus]|uniref:Mut7-C RNAse domain-containing protein n=1 Tax=Halobellus inordinatus TaxID=1126236 RepID=UPI002115AD26|nr:Mut7-C RNAse domain-containing protein [Halobellus ramosii]
MTENDSTDRLLLDAMLGKLTTYLRMCGYDAAYILDEGGEWGREPGNDPSDDEILAQVEASDRTLVTRDVELATRATDAVLLSTRDVKDQLREVRDAGYALTLDDPPTRCSACNGELRPVDAAESLPAYAPDPAETDCWRCRSCGQVFWKGSHWDDVTATLEEL